LFGCASATNKSISETSLNELEDLVSQQSFQIEADWAYPLMTQGIVSVANSGLLLPGSNANRIDLMGNSNYFRILGDSVFVSLPYFGERQIGGRYGNSDVGIRFEGKPSVYNVVKEDRRNSYRIEMRFRDEIETLQVYLTLFPSGKANINLNSTHRSSIRYSGRLTPYPEIPE